MKVDLPPNPSTAPLLPPLSLVYEQRWDQEIWGPRRPWTFHRNVTGIQLLTQVSLSLTCSMKPLNTILCGLGERDQTVLWLFSSDWSCQAGLGEFSCLPVIEAVQPENNYKLTSTSSIVYVGSSKTRLPNIEGHFVIRAPWLRSLDEQRSKFLLNSEPHQ